MDTKTRTDRGLSAVLGNSRAGGDGAVEMVSGQRMDLPIEQIVRNPHQPRKNFDEDDLLHLSESIRNHGVLQPLVVRKVGAEFQLIAGERRLRAAQLAGLMQVPVNLVQFTDQQVLEAALVENIQRSDLNPIEKGQSFKDYLDRYQVTQEQLALRLGMDRTSVSNLVNLLNLPKEVQDAIRAGSISLGHAKILKGISDPAQQVMLCKEIMMKGLSVKALELLVKQTKSASTKEEVPVASPVPSKDEAVKTMHVQGIEDDLRRRLAVKLEIRVKAKDKGQIMISFESHDDFERIIEALRK